MEGSATVPAPTNHNNTPLTTTSQRKPKPESAWIWSQYTPTPLETIQKTKGKGIAIADQLITCKSCWWTTKDSLQHGTTSNMRRYTEVDHGITKNNSQSMPILSMF